MATRQGGLTAVFGGGLALVLLALDQLSKTYVVTHFTLGVPAPFLGPLASLTLTHNRTTAMGLAPLEGWPLAVLSGVLVVAIAALGPRLVRGCTPARWGVWVLLGGALGNLADRVRLGYVVDFIDFHFWPVFNIADIAVVCGAALIVLGLARHRPAPPTDEEA